MTTETEKILNIQVNYGDAIAQISEYNAKIAELKQTQKELGEAVEAGTITQNEYQKEMVLSDNAIKTYKDNIRVLNKEIQNEMKQQQQQEGSLKSLRAELSNLTKQYDELSRSERQGAKGKELQDKLNAVTTELKKAEEETQRYYRNVGNYENAVKPMKKELRELTVLLAQMERDGLRGSEAYNEMAKRAGALKNNINDANAEIKRHASDTLLLDDAVNIVTTASTAWQAYQGAVQAFGIESEEAMKAMSKLQGIIAMTNAVQTLATRFTDNSTATYKVFHKVLQLVGLEKKKEAVTTTTATVAQTANNAATGAATTAQAGATAATVAHTTATAGLTTGLTAATVAAKALKVALVTTGIGALVVGIGYLIDGISSLVSWLGRESEAERQAREQQEALNNAMNDGAKKYAEAATEITAYKLKIDQFNGSAQQENKLVEELNSKYGEQMGYQKSLADWKTTLTQKGKAYCQMLMLEAQAQAMLNKYTEIFIQMQTVKMAAMRSGYSEEAAQMLSRLTYAEDLNFYMGEYNNIMAKANQIAADNNFGGYTQSTGSGNTSKGNTNKGTNKGDDTKKQQDKELQDIRKAEDMKRQLINDALEKQRADIIAQYDRQIEDLQKRLETEKNLTEKQRTAINEQITAAETMKKQKLDELDVRAAEMRIQRQQELSKTILQYIEKGSEEEYAYKAAQINMEEELRIAAAEREIADENAKQEMITAIKKEANAKRMQLEDEKNDQLIHNIEADFETRILQARDNELTQLQLKEEERLQILQNIQQREGESNLDFNRRRQEAEEEWLKAKEARIENEREIELAKYEAIAGYMGGLSQIAEAFGEESKTMAKASKLLSLGEVAVQTGVAISKGVAQAQSVPFPQNIAAIATTVTTVMSNIATAIKTIKSAKFAEGGLVRGAGTATSDSIPARLSNGESVINAAATSMFAPILSTLNQLGGGVPIIVNSPQQAIGQDMLAVAVAQGMAYAPRPVVSVEEINTTQNRVAVIEDLRSY